MSNSLRTSEDYELFLYTITDQFPSVRRCPGIVFTDGVTGRKARVAGTGLEVWEIITTYIGVKQNVKRLQKAYHWLTEQQLRAAIGYYTVYGEEIDQQIKQNESWSKDTIIENYPYLNRDSQ